MDLVMARLCGLKNEDRPAAFVPFYLVSVIMPLCENLKPGDKPKYYKGTEPSPKGRGRCAGKESIGAQAKGRDGKTYTVVASKNGVKSWKQKASRKKQAVRGGAPTRFTHGHGDEEWSYVYDELACRDGMDKALRGKGHFDMMSSDTQFEAEMAIIEHQLLPVMTCLRDACAPGASHDVVDQVVWSLGEGRVTLYDGEIEGIPEDVQSLLARMGPEYLDWYLNPLRPELSNVIAAGNMCDPWTLDQKLKHFISLMQIKIRVDGQPPGSPAQPQPHAKEPAPKSSSSAAKEFTPKSSSSTAKETAPKSSSSTAKEPVPKSSSSTAAPKASSSKAKPSKAKQQCVGTKTGVCINNDSQNTKRRFRCNMPSPEGLGICAINEHVGVTMTGADGKSWTVRPYGKGVRWVPA
jgi:hypothetical protein